MDCLVIGCGLSGAVVARFLAEECNKKVVIWDRRSHIAGNMYDCNDEHGILIHKYGPHTFHTKERYLYDYVRRFAKWKEFKLTCMAKIDGKCTPTPFNFTTIDAYYSENNANRLKKRIKEVFGDQETATVVELLESKDTYIQEFAEFLFQKDYSLYTAKQWGIPAKEVDPSILKRVPVRFSYKNGYFDDAYQVMPEKSYVSFFEELLNHNNINVELGIEALHHLQISNDNQLLLNGAINNKPVIYTGALDELLSMQYGSLPYRTLQFDWKFENIESFQDAPVVAYPQAPDYTRITEYKKLPVQNVQGTTYAVEYSLKYEHRRSMEPYYPVLTEQSIRQYEQYRERAKKIKNLFFCGRLADFKYYNMDQALKRALELCNELKSYIN